MNFILFILVGFPVIAAGLSCFLKQAKPKNSLVQAALLFGLVVSAAAFIRPPQQDLVFNIIGSFNAVLGVNALSSAVLVFINLFGLLVSLYSRNTRESKGAYLSYLLLLIAFSNLAVLSKDFLTFIFSWGATLGLLYIFLSLGSGSSARKAFSILGLADFCLMLGICFYVYANSSFLMPEPGSAGLSLVTGMSWAAFLLMLCGALAKAGCGPFHTWIPEAATDVPMPTMAILPASLDKLLGIYLLARMCLDYFELNTAAMALLLFIGSITIIFAVLMALMQHDLRKLLSFHAISQVGYMVMGFGTGVPVGIAAGIFHMINHAIYKSGLFLTAGAVGEKKKTFELDKLGGLALYMPVTFICALVFSLSISGVPPFNGFASKWMLYQGVIMGMEDAALPMRILFAFSLVCAMFGSALTMASFVKFIHAVFLGEGSAAQGDKPSESFLSMRVSVSVLALLCVGLGVLPYVFLRNFIQPAMGRGLIFIGSWNGSLAVLLVGAGFLLGLAVYILAFGRFKVRSSSAFIGGELQDEQIRFPATEFYRTIEEVPAVKRIYGLIRNEALDVYNITRNTLKLSAYVVFIFVDRFINLITGLCAGSVLALSAFFRRMHSGVLDMYLAWTLVGLIAMFFILMVGKI